MAMPPKEDCLRATRYICDLLDNSGDYVIQRNDAHEAVVRENPILGRNQEQRTISVIIANSYSSVPAYLKKVGDNAAAGIYTAPVLYKDGESAFVLLTEEQRRSQALRAYRGQKKYQMICLEKWEKLLVPELDREVTYYQPKTQRLRKSLRRFRLHDVKFSYRLPEEIGTITEAAMFRFGEGLNAKVIGTRAGVLAPEIGTKISTLSTQRITEELEKMARSYFPGMNREMALAALNGEPL